MKNIPTALVLFLIGLLSNSGFVAAEEQGTTLINSIVAGSKLPLTAKERHWLATHPEIRLGVDPAWAPFEFFDSDSSYSGMAADYMDLIKNILPLSMEPVADLSWSEVIEKIRQGEIDVLPCVVETPQRGEYLRFTDTYLKYPMVIITRDDASFLSGLEMLHGHQVGVVDSYASIDLIGLAHPEIDLVRFETLDEGLAALSVGQIEAFVDNLASVSFALKRTGITNLKIAANTPYYFDLAIGVRKDWPELVGILNKALASISQSEKNRIRNNWISTKFEHGVYMPKVIKIGLAGLVLVLLIFVIIIFWNRKLSQEVMRRQVAEYRLLLRNKVLDSVSTGHSLQQILEMLVKQIELESPEMICSVLLVDERKKRLFLGAAPNLPDFYNEAINGIVCGIGEGSCGTAAFTGETVIVENIQTHPYWMNYKDLANRAGLRACWSQPILSSAGKTIGTFAIYYSNPRAPTEDDLTLIKESATLAAVAIERYQINESIKKLSLAVQHSPNVVVITDIEGVIEYVNPKFTDVTGYDSEDVMGKTPSILSSGEMKNAVYEDLWQTLLDGREWRGEMHNRRKNGELYWAKEYIAPIFSESGKVTHFVAIQEDITESRRVNEELSYQATHDNLTGLINRREFERRLIRVVKTAEEENTSHALCFMDLDQFKILNDTCGHVAGDELLRQLGVLMREQLRKRDTLARLGGDEFAILMEHCGQEQAMRTAEDIRQLIEKFRFHWEEHIFNLGVSIGVTAIDKNSQNATEVLKNADTACYVAKDAGRNCIHLYQEDDELLTQRRGDFQRVQDIKDALEHDNFKLYVQPIISLTDESADRAYEVLIRMIDKKGKTILPGGFLPTAERYNLSTDIDLWVIDHVFQWLTGNQNKLTGIAHIAINLSGISLGSERLLGHLVKAFESGDIPAHLIKFEITETAAIANLSDAQVFIKSLKEHGCQFALDDFGSGLSSFAYLKNLPVDCLKIDGMFVKDIMHDPIDDAMVRSINDIGHVMGMTTIAEFVENHEIQQRLVDIGVDYGQGFGIGRPRPIDDIFDE